MYRLIILLTQVVIISTLAAEPHYLPIIDVHVHTYHDLADGDRITDSEKMRQTIEVMDEFNIVKGIISGPDFDVVARWHVHDPERFVPGILIPDPKNLNTDGSLSQTFLEKLRQQLEAGYVQVIGEVGLQYFDYGPNDPVYEPLYSLAEEFDVPMAIHAYTKIAPDRNDDEDRSVTHDYKYQHRKGNPLLLEKALIKHPDLRLYVMHAGWPFAQEMITILKAFPRVYVDLTVIARDSGLAGFHRYLKQLMNAGMEKRIMFGSDPDTGPGVIRRDTARHIEYIESAGFLSEQHKRDIFYNNALRFFRFDPEKQP